MLHEAQGVAAFARLMCTRALCVTDFAQSAACTALAQVLRTLLVSIDHMYMYMYTVDHIGRCVSDHTVDVDRVAQCSARHERSVGRECVLNGRQFVYAACHIQ